MDTTARKPEFYQRKSKSIESLVDRVIDSTRRISLDLRPGILDCGIVAAVQLEGKKIYGPTGISVSFTQLPTPQDRINLLCPPLF